MRGRHTSTRRKLQVVKVSERPSLRNLNTFGVDATAAFRMDIEREEDVLELPFFNPDADLLLGGGSNILLIGNVPGNVLINRIRGRHLVDSGTDTMVVEIGAGENWHETVGWTLDQGFFGLENLALIPGSVGAAPIQNIGAYGVELAERVESVTAWDLEKQCWQVIPGEECQFSYRDSRFKSSEPHRYLITSLCLRLDRVFQPRLGYQGLSDELAGIKPESLEAKDVFEAVIRIRSSRLPDPARVGNAGSFFKNPVINEDSAQKLIASYPGMPHWPAGNGKIKLAAAWMIEECGLKGYTNGPAGVSEQHALVLINLGGASGQQIHTVARHVSETVFNKFRVQLEPEPRIIQFGI